MKKFFLAGIIVALTTMFYSCKSDVCNKIDNITSITTNSGDVEQYIKANTYIDVDVETLAKEISSPFTRSSINLDKVAKMKAAIYRFYSNVELKNGLYHCKLNSASEINVSAKVYNTLLSNLNQINDSIKEAKTKGQDIHLSVVNEKYLNSLLK